MTFRVGRGDASARAAAQNTQEDPRPTKTQVESDVGMSAFEALSGMFSKPFGFSGTASRGEFGFKILWANIFSFAILVAWMALSMVAQLDSAYMWGVLFWMVVILIWAVVYGLPLYARRMRDTGQSAWMVALVLLAIAGFSYLDPTNKAQSLLNLIFFAYLCSKPSA